MNNKLTSRHSQVYQQIVSVSGIAAWLIAVARICTSYGWRDQFTFLSLMPVIIIACMFVQTFRLPLGSKFTQDRVTFTLTDGLVLLVACWFGTAPAVFVAGIEGFISSRRTARRLSSNVFSSAMMSIGAAGASLTLGAVLRYGYGEMIGTGLNHTLPAVAVAMLAGGVVQIAINIALFSTLLTLRRDDRAWAVLKGFLCAVPMFLPNSAAAYLMYYALQHDLKMIVVIGGPIFLAIYFGQRQYRDGVQKRITVMEKAHRETIEALAVAINAKDEVTHEHVLRVQIYAAGVARLLGCSEAEIEALKAGALLHDIGKISVPDYILNKPGKLTAAEFERMKMHTIVGAQILGRVDFHYPVVPIVRHHHERWDGHGYPDGLKSEEIPLTARILTVVDCFDALREDRQYRRGLTREEALDFLLQNSGSQYDPRVVGKFITHLAEFEAEIAAHKDQPLPSFGIEPAEKLSEAARQVAPSAGLAATENDAKDEINFSRQELSAVYDLLHALKGPTSRDELMNTFTEKLAAIVPYTTCMLTLVAPDSGELLVRHARGPHAELLQGRRIEAGEGITGWVMANQKPFCNTDPRLDFPVEMADTFKAYRTIGAVPIVREKELHGALTVYSSDLAEYDKDQQKLLRESAAIFAAAFAALARGPSIG